MAQQPNGNRRILVVGGGISGISAAVEVAEVGYKVLLVERRAYLGGRVAQLNQYFPKLCPSSCGLEINLRRIRNNPRIEMMTLTEVQAISGRPGDYEVSLKIHPRYVNEKCTCCGRCEEVCSVEVDDEFNYGMSRVKAAHLPNKMAYPMRYVLAPELLETEDAARCKEACPYDAIELQMEPKVEQVKVGAIVWATGWRPYDASRLEQLGFGSAKNVVTNVMMERLASGDGPTNGAILRPSDRKQVESVAFVQCAGSRDDNHLPFCSAVCCSASLKQASYIREQYPDSRVYIFYIDLRTPGRLEDFLDRIQKDDNVVLTKGKVARVTEDPESGDVIIEAEDIAAGGLSRLQVDMVVLATGMEPEASGQELPSGLFTDEHGFLQAGADGMGIFAAGCAKRPMDVASCVQDATAAALKAIQSAARRD